MISINTFIKINNDFIDVFDFDKKIKNNDYIDGAIELTINGKN
ncbi:hypothetical protein PAK39_16300 [Proteus mirabilis]|nr:hypothetical protein [Proteus mirabilis]MDM3558090.1 hypothetical protein [Proteus mirabilis]